MNTSERAFRGAPESVAGARNYVDGELSEVDRGLRDAVVLMVSELATNAIVHGRSGFVVRMIVSSDEIRFEVADEGPGDPEAQHPMPSDPSGRGLFLVSRFAERWGVDSRAPSGKTVWFTVPRAPVGRSQRASSRPAGREAAREPSWPSSGRPSSAHRPSGSDQEDDPPARPVRRCTRQRRARAPRPTPTG